MEEVEEGEEDGVMRGEEAVVAGVAEVGVELTIEDSSNGHPVAGETRINNIQLEEEEEGEGEEGVEEGITISSLHHSLPRF